MTEPYYQDAHVTLYLGDCREVTEWLDADVLVTDPPYGIGWQSAWRTAIERFETIKGDADVTLRGDALTMWGGGAGVGVRHVARPAPVWRSAATHLGEGRRPWTRGSVDAVGLRRRGDLRAR